jgi:hypothetical protein
MLGKDSTTKLHPQSLALFSWKKQSSARGSGMHLQLCTWEAEAGGSLEPKSLRSAWAAKKDPVSKKKNLFLYFKYV